MILNERILVKQSIHAWIKAGLSPDMIFEGIADAFESPDSLIEAGYEVFGSDRKRIEGSIREIAKQVRIWE